MINGRSTETARIPHDAKNEYGSYNNGSFPCTGIKVRFYPSLIFTLVYYSCNIYNSTSI